VGGSTAKKKKSGGIALKKGVNRVQRKEKGGSQGVRQKEKKGKVKGSETPSARSWQGDLEKEVMEYWGEKKSTTKGGCHSGIQSKKLPPNMTRISRG